MPTTALPIARRVEHLDEDLLLALVREGSEPACVELDRRHRPALVAAARRLLAGTAHDPEDAAQDVLIRAHAFLLSHAERPVALGPWLKVVLRNRCIDLRRRQSPLLAADIADRPAPRTDPVVVLAERERLRGVLGEVAGLPERQRTALVGRAFDGASHNELAERLETTPAAVKSLLGRARAALAPEAA